MIKRFFYWLAGKHLHQWDDWEITDVYITQRYGRVMVGCGWVKRQLRKCKTCGLTQHTEL